MTAGSTAVAQDQEVNSAVVRGGGVQGCVLLLPALLLGLFMGPFS